MEAESAEDALKQIEYAENEVLTAKPPYPYETNRESLMTAISFAKSAMTGYINAVKENSNIEKYTDQLKAAYYSITGTSVPTDIVKE